jgi:Beta-lactamase enzyme family
VRREPTHAGKLPAWERVVFGLVFALMAAFVVAVTVSAAHAQRSGLRPGAGVPASVLPDSVLPAGPAPAARVQTGAGALGTGQAAPAGDQAALNRKLAAALRPEERVGSERLAVGVIDLSTGAEALYGARLRFPAASVMKADILAVLLLQHQVSGSQLSNREAELAVAMIESSDDGAATSLWRSLGGGRAISAANQRLGLLHTTPGKAGNWGRSRTTVADQLRLLADLTAATSPLTAQSRDYELGLMQDVQPDQQWGVTAAATPGSGRAVRDGWMANPTLWVVNSIGVVEHAGHRLLLAVLSDRNATKAAGVAAVATAARTAARVLSQTS